MVQVKASGPPHVLKMWLAVNKGMLPVWYFGFNRAYLYVSEISWRSIGCYKDEVNLASLGVGESTRYKTVVSVSLYGDRKPVQCVSSRTVCT